jgi:hypothetical protein
MTGVMLEGDGHDSVTSPPPHRFVPAFCSRPSARHTTVLLYTYKYVTVGAGTAVALHSRVRAFRDSRKRVPTLVHVPPLPRSPLHA